MEVNERNTEEREVPDWVREWRRFRRDSDERIRQIKERLAQLRAEREATFSAGARIRVGGRRSEP